MTAAQKVELRIARAKLELIALQLREPRTPELERAIGFVNAAARRLEAIANARRVARCGTTARAVRAVASRDESYVEYDDGSRVPRS